MKNDSPEAAKLLSSLVDFFWVHFDAKVAKQVSQHPELAIPLLKERISSGLRSPGLLRLYATAMASAADYLHLLSTQRSSLSVGSRL